MLLKALKLCEKFTIRRNAINDSDRVVDIVSGNQHIASILDGTHVSWSNVTGSADKGEIFHGKRCPSKQAARMLAEASGRHC
ncbi:hypothetical protein D3C76_1211560 [compost metagenome]